MPAFHVLGYALAGAQMRVRAVGFVARIGSGVGRHHLWDPPPRTGRYRSTRPKRYRYVRVPWVSLSDTPIKEPG
eukprot:scaffold824_cov327-Pavlova_lutheri.AAC.48